MSSNIYRVNKKNDLDELFQDNFYKPICIVLAKGLKNKEDEFNKNLIETLLSISKICTYSIIVVIDFDSFDDSTGFYDSIKETNPFFLIYYEASPVVHYSKKDDFIPVISQLITKFNDKYRVLISRQIKPNHFINDQTNDFTNNQVTNQQQIEQPIEQIEQPIEQKKQAKEEKEKQAKEEEEEEEEEVKKKVKKKAENKKQEKSKTNNKKKKVIQNPETKSEEEFEEESEEENESEELDSNELREKEKKLKKLNELRNITKKQKSKL